MTLQQSDVLFEKRDGIAWITLNRPTARNALTKAMFKHLASAITGLRNDSATRLVVLRGSGTDFTVGADLKDMSGVASPSPAERGEQLAALAREMSWPIFLGLHELRQPIIASVRGHVIGAGAQLVLSADLTIASDTTRFLLPQVRLGHPVDHGESYYLPRKIGIGRAMQLLLLAETLSAAQAEQYGLINWAVPDADLDKKTEELVQRIANGATVAICETKALLRQSTENSFADQFAAEARSLAICAATDDFPEAINAFLEKRKPAFKGR
jgi:2-(1,2-epoxy-1,2-dihydrophenyl)acetyl-CoA isomerase